MPMPTTPEPERRGTLRADKTAAWIELTGAKLALDAGERELWAEFADREVIVTGACVGDAGQFRIHSLSVADRTRGMGAYFAVGPEQVLDGDFAIAVAPPGSKAWGSSQRVFDASGQRYGVLGATDGMKPGPAQLRVRVLEPDMSYHARSLDQDVWIIGPATGDPAPEPDAVPCPGDT